LAVMLDDPGGCGAVDAAIAVGITPADFYRPLHAATYARILELHALGQPHTPIDLRRELEATDSGSGLLHDAGGPSWLHTLFEQRGMAEWAAEDAATIADLGQRRRVMDAAIQAARLAADPATPLARTTGLLASKLGAVALPGERDRSVDGATFALDTPVAATAIWGDNGEIAWAAGEALMLVGPQGVGKTTLAGQLTLARVGLRKELLGMPVTPTASRVLYLACDRPQQIRRSFRRMVSEADRELLAERLVVWQGPPPGDVAKQPTLLVDLARRAGADTIVVDSLKDAVADLVKDEAGAGYNRARQTALVSGIELVELHHQRKAGPEGRRPRTLSDVYGSVWLTAGSGSVLLLWGDPGDPVVELHHLKQPAEEIGPAKLLHDPDAGTTIIHQGTDLLGMVASKPGLTAADAARLLFDVQGRSPEAREIEKARRKLDALVTRRLLFRKEGSRGGATKTPATYHLAAREGERP